MFRLLAPVTLLLSSATGRRTRASTALYVGSRAGIVGAPDLFCGATIEGHSSVLCGLPGRSARTGRIMSGQLAARLDDSSFLDARLDADTAA